MEAGTLIVGAGVAGSALAMHLAEMGEPDVVVVDPDLAGERSSSERNAGGVRATWWQEVNVELCAHTIEYLRGVPEAAMRPNGYLWLYGPELWPRARAHIAMQNRHGREVEGLTAAEVGRRFPVIDRLDGIAGATLSPRDGLVSPNAVKEHYRARARAAGARFVDRTLVVGARSEGRRVAALHLTRVADGAAAGAALAGARVDGPRETVRPRRVVNAAGPWAAPLAAALGTPVPCRAVPRQVSLFAGRDVDLSPYGMIVDTTGLYLHHESGEICLAGYSPPGDPPGYRLDDEGRAFFEREIWPRLAARMEAMDRLEHVGGWAGLYELSPDNSAVVGAVPGRDDLYEIHSFSGRGVMQSYAAALALAELMVTGAHRTFPRAAALSATRFSTGALLPEELHI